MPLWFLRPFNTRYTLRSVAILFVMGCLVWSGVSLWRVQQQLQQPIALSTDRTILEVPAGSSCASFVERLAQRGWISSPRSVRAYLAVLGCARRIKAGDYAVTLGMSVHDVTAAVFAGREWEYAFTVVPGWQWRDVQAALTQEQKIRMDLEENNPSDAAFDVVSDVTAFSAPYPMPMLLPETYFFRAHTSAKALVRRAQTAFAQTVDRIWQERSRNDVPLDTPEAFVVAASIIEKETCLAHERARIAGVLYRRLKQGMPLQMDPTVRYAFALNTDQVLLRRHVQTDHPYNTYTRKGLPPGPIAFPSVESLRAAAAPDTQYDDLYFVATGTGGHVFSKTFAEHQKAVALYRKRMQEQKS